MDGWTGGRREKVQKKRLERDGCMAAGKKRRLEGELLRWMLFCVLYFGFSVCVECCCLVSADMICSQIEAKEKGKKENHNHSLVS